MSHVLGYVLLAAMGLVVLDALVLVVGVVGRRLRRRRAQRAVQVARLTTAADLTTVLYAVPAHQDALAVLPALADAGFPALTDPLDDHVLLISCPRGPGHRDEVRALLAREAQRLSRTPGLDWSGPVRFTDEV